ncbi:MAG TPA: immunoglobulin domain-containing protein [Opitutus sp.]|nr:immunoglobulin domain-containing protein [Opitutus sp.]
MKTRIRRRLGAAVFAILFAAPTAHAYVLMDPPYWPEGTVTLTLKLGSSPTYSDGSNPNSTAQAAAQEWNPYMARLQLATTTDAKGEGAYDNNANDVFFSNTIYGYGFDGNILAVTLVWSDDTRRTETDVIVNQGQNWDAYRGGLRNNTTDLRRVLAHEFGHVLGLGHSSQDTLMNYFVTYVEAPTQDDREGVSVLYGHTAANPAIPPSVNLAAENLSVREGLSAVFTIYWSGSLRMSFQWQKDGVNIPGATAESYSLPAVKLTDAGKYSVVLTNDAGSVSSPAAQLDVFPTAPPVAGDYGPYDAEVYAGQRAGFYCSVDNPVMGPFSFQWRQDGAAIPGANNQWLYIDPATVESAGTYDCIISNSAGSATSRPAQLIVSPAVTPVATLGNINHISEHAGALVYLGSRIIAGTGPFTYQWEKNGIVLPGDDREQLILQGLTAQDAGVYSLRVTNFAGDTVTEGVVLSVDPLPRPPAVAPSVRDGPTDGGFEIAFSPSFDFGAGTETYQWYHNGQPMTALTHYGYETGSQSASDAGDYVMVITHDGGSTASLTASFVPSYSADFYDANGWTFIQRSGDVVYFLAQNPALIRRYSLASKTWLAPIPLSGWPTAFCVDLSQIYVAIGSAISRMDLSGANSAPFAIFPDEVDAMIAYNGFLYVLPNSNTTSDFSSIRLSDGALIASNRDIRGSPTSISVARTLGMLFWRGYGEMEGLLLNGDGSFGLPTWLFTDVDSDFPRTFVAPDETYVVDNAGWIHGLPTLESIGTLGEPFNDLAFTPSGVPLVLRRGSVTAFDDDFRETGRLILSSPGVRMAVTDQTAFFFAPAVSGSNPVSVATQPLTAIVPRPRFATVNPVGLTYTPAEIILGADGVLYLLCRERGNVFRWSLAEGRYLDSIPLTGSPNGLCYSPTAKALYAGYADNRITRIALTGVPYETAFATTPLPVTRLLFAGNYVAAYEGTAGRLYSADGKRVPNSGIWAWPAESWNEPLNRFYMGDGNNLAAVALATDGTDLTQNSVNVYGYDPVRGVLQVSPDGRTIVLGGGAICDGDTLAQVAALPFAIGDAAWTGSTFYTARDTFDGVRIERWSAGYSAVDAAGVVSGRLLRLFARPDGGLLLVVMRNGAPAFVALDASLGGATAAAPQIFAQPCSLSESEGRPMSLSLNAPGASTYAWTKDGIALAGATASTFTTDSLEPADAGIYGTTVTGLGKTISAAHAIVGLTTTTKVAGSGAEVGQNIRHPNGNYYDQVLLQGEAASITADSGQVTRTSYIDRNGDIVQVEFSGTGTLSLVLSNYSGPAAPENYTQPSVSYMKGDAGIVITGADETTNVSVFTVGRATAFDPTGAYDITKAISATNNPANNGSPLFQDHGGTSYDGVADLRYVAILSRNGYFGGLRASNARFDADAGLTGVYAPGVQFAGPVYVGNIDAHETATPVLVVGSVSDARVTGGNLAQTNSQAVEVAGLTQLTFTAGTNSAGTLLAAQHNQARLEQDGNDLTDQIVVNPTP